MTRTRTVAWAGAVNLLGGVTGALVNLALAALVARSLGPEGAGAYFLVVAVVLIVANVAELGADTGLVRYAAAARATGRDADLPWLLNLAIRPVGLVVAVVAVVAAVLSVWTSDVLPGVGAPVVAVCGAFAGAATLTAVVLGLVRGVGDVMAYPVLQSVLLPVLRLTGVATVVALGGGAGMVVLAWLAPLPLILVIAVAVMLRLLRRFAGRVRPGERREGLRREFWSFSAARGVTAAVEILLEWVDVIVVGALASPAAAGVYAVVTRCVRAGELVQQAARIAIAPRISAALAKGATEEARQLYGWVSAAMIWLSWPFFLTLMVSGDVVLGLFGEEFASGHTSMAVLAGALGLATAAGSVQTVLLMGGRSSWQLADKTGALVLDLVLCLVLVPHHGILGAAVAWAVTIVVDTSVVVWQVQHLMGLRAPRRPIAIAAGLSLVIFGGGMLVARQVTGDGIVALLASVAVLGVVHLAAGTLLRDRIGLTSLARTAD